MAETKHRENIQVFVRVRSLNAKEKTENAYSIIDCSGTQEITVRDVENRSKLKTFTYDKVFSQKSKQIDVYKDVMQSHIEEVLSGYNCTVFAYGQTGTGKTYTMEGERSSQTTNWQEDPNAGIIPRALNQIFDELQSKFSDFAIRVSYLELYNEELFDLLSPVDDTTKLRLFEDSSKKGSVIIKGLEEATVTNKNEVYKILEKGSAKRQTASTLMNAQSSRSHTIFSVTVHIHEEDYVRIGKLNLVDLAGSENIGRSGAVDKRAREAGNINQSLLTLGRVITCLVEGAPHIPYRESKLTRLLQDSLGGKTKTTIVATISPANSNVEETVSTLEYAHRAKNIQNKPEVNKVLTQKSILKEYNEQIERLKRDLKAVQDKTGITISEENYEHMIHQIGSQEKKLLEKMHQIKAMEEERDKQSRIMENFQTLLQEKQDELQSVNEVLIKTETVKKEITEQAKVLHEVVKVTSKHTELLHDKLDRKAKIDLQNANALAKYKSEFHKYFDKLENLHASFIEAFNTLSEEHEQFVSDQVEKDEEIKEGFYQNCAAIENKIDEVIKNVTTLLTENTNKSIDWASLLVEKLQELTDQENIGFRSFVEDNVVPLLTEIIAIKEKMTTDVLELEEINNDCVDTMEVDSEMKKDLLSQLRNDKVAVTNGIDAVGRELATLEAKQHELTRHNDEQMMKTNELMVDISHSMETNKQLYEDLLEINKKLDESEHNLIVTVNNFSSFVANKFASMYEMIENAQEGQKKEIEGIQQLCTAYEVQNDDGRSLLLNPSRGLAEKLKSFSNSQSEMISSNVEMISSFVSDGKSDLSKLAAGNEKTKELVDSLATNFHKFEGKLSSLKILDKKLADELVEMIEENNRSSKESSEKDIKHILESLDTFNSNLTKFFERKLRRLPEPSGDTPKREDLMKLAEEAGVEVDIDVFPNNANRLFQQIPSGKEKENVREAVSPKSNLSIPVPGTSSRVLEELNKN